MLLLAIFLALIPGFAWLVFFLQEDDRPEPKWLIALVFFAGALSAFVALPIQVLIEKLGLFFNPITGFHNEPLILILGSLLAYSFVEELVKFLATYFSVRNKPDFDRPLDAMLFMVVAALGFATIENIGAVAPRVSTSVNLGIIYETLSLRFIGATILHALCSGIVGYYWAKTIRDFGLKRYLIGGIILATFLHAVFNYLILQFESLGYILVFVIVMGLVVLHDFDELKTKTI